MKRVQDNVHGLIEFTGRETLVINALGTPEVQRLRHVRHLGLAHLVFPGAEHSRFAHSLGVAHLAGRFARTLRAATGTFLAESLRVDDGVARDLVLAGLCHDLGHGPLSHAWERYVIRRPKFNEWARALSLPERPWINREMKWHELVTQACLLSEDSQLRHLLEDVETGLGERVAALLGNRYYLPYLSRMLNSDIDVDRADFILRDGIQSGVAYGRYDLDWLVSTLTVGVHGDEAVIGFDMHKSPRVVEQFLIARRPLYQTVYFHRTVQSAELMMGRLLGMVQERLAKGDDLGVSQGFETLERAIRGDTLPLHELIELDDDLVWVYIDRLAHASTDKTIKDFADRLRVRDLLKPLPLTDRELEVFLADPRRAFAIAVREIKRFVSGDPARYLLFNSVPFRFFETDPSHEGMLIDTKSSDHPATRMKEHPELFHFPRSEDVLRTLFVPRLAREPLARAIRAEIAAGSFDGGSPLSDAALEEFFVNAGSDSSPVEGGSDSSETDPSSGEKAKVIEL